MARRDRRVAANGTIKAVYRAVRAARVRFREAVWGAWENRQTVANFVDKTVWTGDNLNILRGINSESVDLIYLAPPLTALRVTAPLGCGSRRLV